MLDSHALAARASEFVLGSTLQAGGSAVGTINLAEMYETIILGATSDEAGAKGVAQIDPRLVTLAQLYKTKLTQEAVTEAEDFGGAAAATFEASPTLEADTPKPAHAVRRKKKVSEIQTPKDEDIQFVAPGTEEHAIPLSGDASGVDANLGDF